MAGGGGERGFWAEVEKDIQGNGISGGAGEHCYGFMTRYDGLGLDRAFVDPKAWKSTILIISRVV